MRLDGRDLAWMAAEAGLTERERQMMELRYVQELSYSAVARLLGVAEATVRVTISHARDKLEAHQWPPAEQADAGDALAALTAADYDVSPGALEYAHGVLEALENRTAGHARGVTVLGLSLPERRLVELLARVTAEIAAREAAGKLVPAPWRARAVRLTRRLERLRERLAAAAQVAPPLPKVRMVTVGDVLMLIREREGGM
jgi:DNA-binding CsgD family transcriptional regulator